MENKGTKTKEHPKGHCTPRVLQKLQIFRILADWTWAASYCVSEVKYYHFTICISLCVQYNFLAKNSVVPKCRDLIGQICLFGWFEKISVTISSSEIWQSAWTVAIRRDEFEKPTKYLQGFYVLTLFNRVTFLLPSAAALCLYALHSHSLSIQ